MFGNYVCVEVVYEGYDMCWFVEYGFDEVEYCFVGEWIDCGWLLGDMVGVVLVLCDCWVMLVGYVECEVID